MMAKKGNEDGRRVKPAKRVSNDVTPPKMIPRLEAANESRPRGRTAFRILLSLSVAGLLLWLVYRKMDFAPLVNYFKGGHVRYDIFLISILVEATANVVRGLRWRLQMLPLGPPFVRRKTAIAAVMGCYTVNVVLPRAGELWRSVVVSRSEKLMLSSVLGTLITDRLMDLVAMLLLLLAALVLFYGDSLQLLSQISLSGAGSITFFSSPRLYVLLAVLILLLLVFRKIILRSRFWMRLQGFSRNFLMGFLSIAKMPYKWLFAFYTLLLWVLYFVAFYMTFYAFPFTKNLGFGVGLLAFIMGTIGVSIPVQAGIGPWHFMVITTLTVFGVAASEAGAFALIVHTTQIFGTALVGLLVIFFVPLLGRKQQINQIKR